MDTKDSNTNSFEEPDAGTARKPVSRRALLKGSVISMPVILTLQSGAALARSSNLISGSLTESPDRYDRNFCLDVDSVYPAGDSGHVYDLGEPPYARVSIIEERDYRVRPWRRADGIGEAEMCEKGGTYYYKNRFGHWRDADVPRGVLVSATALTSFAGDIVINDL